MGADLLLTWVRMPHDGKGNVVSKDRAMPPLQSRIAGLVDDAFLEGILESRHGESAPGDEADDLDLFEDEYGTRDWRQYVRGLIEESLPVLYEGNRDTARVRLPGSDEYLFAGGTSWGEDPGPSWDAVTILAESGITEEPIR